MPQIYQLPLGALGTNCYIIPGEDSRAVVIDPASAAEVEMFLNTHGLKLGTIIVTHGHYDHFAGAAQLMESTGALLLASAPDEAMYSSAAKCWADFMPVEFRPIKPDKLFSDGEEFTAEGLKFLGNGELTKSLTVKAAKFTAGAQEKIEKAGGKAEVI